MAQDHASEQEKPQRDAGTPLLEWISAAIGLAITLAMLGFIGWQAWKGGNDAPPAIEVTAGAILRTDFGYVVEFTAENLSESTAASVQVQGELTEGGRTIATGETTLDYVPGDSVRRGGLFFEDDPAAYQLELRALGYAKP